MKGSLRSSFIYHILSHSLNGLKAKKRNLHEITEEVGFIRSLFNESQSNLYYQIVLVSAEGRDVKLDSLVKSVSPNAENSVDFIPTFLTSFFLTVPELLW